VGYLIARQNRPIKEEQENKNRWVLLPVAGAFRIVPEDRNRPLFDLQKDAIEFGEYLQGLARELKGG
jgi:hypothetical protein